jgi:nicotinate-nucleotide adenylyltransferase
MGADSFMNIHRWKYWRGIMETVPVAIVPRPGSSLASIRAKVARQMEWARVPTSRPNRLFNHHPPAWMMLAAELDKRSASAIRARGEWP